MEKYRVILTLSEPILGTVPKDKEIYSSYVADQATSGELEKELETVPEKLEEKGWTGFHELDGQPVLYDYVIKGFFKDACGILRRVAKSPSSRLKAFKKEIDGLVFVKPKRIPLVLPEGEAMGVCERPLRASTAQGERVALARSDTCPVGTTLAFTVTVLGGSVDEETLRSWLDYGQYRGLGQWRNSGAGRFTYEMAGL